MKTYIIDWLANDGGWGSGFIVMNREHRASPVSIGFNSDKPVQVMIPPWGRHIPTVPPNTNSSAAIIGSDSISVFATTWLNNASCLSVPVREARALGEAIYPFASSVAHDWQSSPFWTTLKGEAKPARYNKALQMAALQMAAIQVYFEFERMDKALGVMDACPLAGDAPGHPLGSHSAVRGDALDVSYYTMRTNNTQIGASPEAIFSNGNLTANFDMKRNARFFELVSRYLPEARIMVDERIAFALGFPAYLQGDPPSAFNHDKHAHIVMGDKINSGAIL